MHFLKDKLVVMNSGLENWLYGNQSYSQQGALRPEKK